MDTCSVCHEYLDQCICDDYTVSKRDSFHVPDRSEQERERRKLEEFEILKRHHYGQVDHERKHS